MYALLKIDHSLCIERMQVTQFVIQGGRLLLQHTVELIKYLDALRDRPDFEADLVLVGDLVRLIPYHEGSEDLTDSCARERAEAGAARVSSSRCSADARADGSPEPDSLCVGPRRAETQPDKSRSEPRRAPAAIPLRVVPIACIRSRIGNV